jgi:hypothetical protein
VIPVCGMTDARCAWCKANAYVRSDQYARAVYWLSRTQEILNGDRPRRQRLKRMDTDYILAALSVVLFVSGSPRADGEEPGLGWRIGQDTCPS